MMNDRNVTHLCRLRSTMEKHLLANVSEELAVELDTKSAASVGQRANLASPRFRSTCSARKK